MINFSNIYDGQWLTCEGRPFCQFEVIEVANDRSEVVLMDGCDGTFHVYPDEYHRYTPIIPNAKSFEEQRSISRKFGEWCRSNPGGSLDQFLRES